MQQIIVTGQTLTMHVVPQIAATSPYSDAAGLAIKLYAARMGNVERKVHTKVPGHTDLPENTGSGSCPCNLYHRAKQ